VAPSSAGYVSPPLLAFEQYWSRRTYATSLVVIRSGCATTFSTSATPNAAVTVPFAIVVSVSRRVTVYVVPAFRATMWTSALPGGVPHAAVPRLVP